MNEANFLHITLMMRKTNFQERRDLIQSVITSDSIIGFTICFMIVNKVVEIVLKTTFP